MIHIGFKYPQEVVDLATTLPFSTDQVMGVYVDHGRDIEMAELVLRFYMRTGHYLRREHIQEVERGMSDLQEIPRRDILEYIKTYSIRYYGCLTGEVFQDAIKEIERLQDELKRTEMINDENLWISVEDRLPEHDERILAYSPQMAGTEAEIQIQKGFMVSRKRSDISHWMSLPEPPEK